MWQHCAYMNLHIMRAKKPGNFKWTFYLLLSAPLTYIWFHLGVCIYACFLRIYLYSIFFFSSSCVYPFSRWEYLHGVNIKVSMCIIYHYVQIYMYDLYVLQWKFQWKDSLDFIEMKSKENKNEIFQISSWWYYKRFSLRFFMEKLK